MVEFYVRPWSGCGADASAGARRHDLDEEPLMTAQREWFEKDYYATLGVSKDASAKEVTRAYRKLARRLHPDANPGDQAAEARF